MKASIPGEYFMHDTNKRRKNNVMWYIRWKWLKLLSMIEIFMRIMDVFPFLISSPLHFIHLQITFSVPSIVWREDYFLTKLKTYLHTMCHVLLWCFKIGMFNKLLIILLLVLPQHHLWFLRFLISLLHGRFLFPSHVFHYKSLETWR